MSDLRNAIAKALEAIDNCVASNPEESPQTIRDFWGMFLGDIMKEARALEGASMTTDDEADDVRRREWCLKAMQTVSDSFYAVVVLLGNHAFIEFTGLLNEYIKLCREAHNQGIDFTQANKHGSVRLPFAPHHIAYLNEKLECIYGVEFTVKHNAKPPSAPTLMGIVDAAADRFDQRPEHRASIEARDELRASATKTRW